MDFVSRECKKVSHMYIDYKTVDATVEHHNPQSRQKYISMINQSICINDLGNRLQCSMQCCLNGVHVSEWCACY